jgi:hypothetical protein
MNHERFILSCIGFFIGFIFNSFISSKKPSYIHVSKGGHNDPPTTRRPRRPKPFNPEPVPGDDFYDRGL